MADNAILASLLTGQRRRRDPFEDRRKYALGLMQQGASTAPLQSGNPLEGVARALTAGVGGYFSGQADRDSDARDQKTTSVIGDLLTAKSPDELKAKLEAAKGSGADMEVLAPIMGQILSESMSDQRKTALGQRAYGAAGGTMPGMPGQAMPQAGGPPQMPPQGSASPTGGIDTSTLAPPGVAQPGYSMANNPGNIRTSPAAWEGKGQPQNGFETFQTPQAGANAQFKNFQAYAQANPNMTVAQALAKWAPPNENDTGSYIRSIAEASGINPGMPLAEVLKDPAVAATLLDAQTRLEKGGLPQGFTADTFMAATGGNPAGGATGGFAPPDVAGSTTRPGVPGPVAAPQVAQGGDGSGNPPKPGQSFDAGSDYEDLGRRAAAAGDFEKATAYQMKANEARTQFKTKQFEETDKRSAEGAEYDRRQVGQNESKLRDDFNNLKPVKDYREAGAVFRTAVEASKTNSAAADLNLVYSFAKLMDPGSVVREGEMGMVQATQSASDRVKSLVAMVSGGQRISPEARQALVREMASRYESYKLGHDEIAKSFGAIAQRQGANPDNVIIPYPGVEYQKSTPRSGPPQAGEVLDGWRFKGGDPSKQSSWEQVQ
jgi:hypothetical protein